MNPLPIQWLAGIRKLQQSVLDLAFFVTPVTQTNIFRRSS